MVTTFISVMFVPSIFMYFMLVSVCLLTSCLCVLYVSRLRSNFCCIFATNCGRPGLRWACVCGGFRSAGSSLALGGFRKPVRDSWSVSQCRFVLGTRSVSCWSAGYSHFAGQLAVRLARLGVRWPGRAAMRLGLLLVVALCCRPGILLGGRICGFL